ncbi:MAG: ABC transporter permease [bacterium]|nr:ABC transporter permease [bacterium]
MRLSIAAKTALAALRGNLGRSLLTILGIVIGIVAIVLVVAIGQGAQSLILSQVESIGGNALVIRPGRQPTGAADIANTVYSDSLKDKDIIALSNPNNVPGLASIDPAVIVPGNVSYQNNIFRPLIFGWTADAMAEIFNIYPATGSYFTNDDIKQNAKVAIIGWHVKDQLFGESPAINQLVTVHQQKMRVVAVLPKTGQLSGFNVDDIVILPYTTAQKEILGIDYFQEVIAKAKPGADINQVAADVKATLREMHNITDPAKDDFFVLTQQDIVDRISTVTQVLTIFLVSIAAISLLVGGVGIMNIMLVSVTERIKEIGLRKAVGASQRDIMQQFLLEAVFLTFSGGLIGTIIAISISLLIVVVIRTQYNLDWPLTIPLGAIALGVGMAVSVGLLFGLYPARQAAKKDPIDALRHE